MFDFTWKEMFVGPVNFVKSFLHCYFIYHYKERCHYQWARIKPRTEEWQIIIWFSSFTDSNSPANEGEVWESLTNRKGLLVRGSGLVDLRANPYLSLSTVFLPPWLWAGQPEISSSALTITSQSSTASDGSQGDWRPSGGAGRDQTGGNQSVGTARSSGTQQGESSLSTGV